MSSHDTASDYVLIGKITSAFGIKGWVKVYSYTENPQDIAQYSPWHLSRSEHAAEQLQSVTPIEVKPQGKVLAASLKECGDRNQAETYHGLWIWAEQTQLPELDSEAFYWRDLIGLTVINTAGENFGKVHQLMETGANDVLQVNPTPESIDNKKRLIPFTMDHAIVAVDLAAQQITVEWDADF